jgi:predicted ArsR family transcriptional regulator
MTKTPSTEAIEAVAQLEEPNRRRLYELVVASREPVGRDAAAEALGMSRELAAFHLDRLVEVGLLETEFRRRGERTGPGAGRTAKFYRRAAHDVAVSLPPRRYEAVAEVMASALDRLPETAAIEARSVARERGIETGAAARASADADAGAGEPLTELLEILDSGGYEPQLDPATGSLWLRNCPYQTVATEHRTLICGMNEAWAEGVVSGLGTPLDIELAPEPGRCCVIFHDPGIEQPSTPLAGPAQNLAGA